MKKNINVSVSAFLITSLFIGFTGTAEAYNAWGNYHWARTSTPFTLKVVDSVTSNWDGSMSGALSDWTQSSVLDLVRENGSISNKDRRSCSPIAGKVHACNYTYGANGWLGLTQIWITGGDHITQATSKFNDSYLATKQYKDIAWKNLVMCHELGHSLGLDHQDTDFYNANLGTCLDYTASPASNQHPNAMDYSTLEYIYSHVDEGSTVAALVSGAKGLDIDTSDPTKRGKLVRESNRHSEYELDLGDGNKIVTHIFWAGDEKNENKRVKEAR